jgi:hypothetical protein
MIESLTNQIVILSFPNITTTERHHATRSIIIDTVSARSGYAGYHVIEALRLGQIAFHYCQHAIGQKGLDLQKLLCPQEISLECRVGSGGQARSSKN